MGDVDTYVTMLDGCGGIVIGRQSVICGTRTIVAGMQSVVYDGTQALGFQSTDVGAIVTNDYTEDEISVLSIL